MPQIIALNDQVVKIGNDDGSVADYPRSSINFANPAIGNQVQVFNDNGQFIVSLVPSQTGSNINIGGIASDGRRHINKIVYLLVTFFLGVLGVHRFMRGQVGIGICMLLFSWLTLGIWPLIEFLIGLVKISSYRGDDFIFTPDGDFANV